MIAGKEIADGESVKKSAAGAASQQSGNATKIVLAIMAGVLLWGTFHAVGVYVSADKPNILKPLIVMSCALAFPGFWAIMLWKLNRKQKT